MITVALPEQARLALKATPEKAGQELLLAAAVELCELGRLSSGAAAELVGVPKLGLHPPANQASAVHHPQQGYGEL